MLTMTLPSIAHQPVENANLKLDLCKLRDEIEVSPSARLRTRSSSRDAVLRKRLLNAGSGSNSSLNRENSSYSLTSRPFSRSRSGNDLRTMVTSRNVLNSAKNAENGVNPVSGRPPVPRAGSMANLASARNPPRVERTASKHSLLANPRSSSGGNTPSRTTPTNTPTVQRKLFKHVSKTASNPDVRLKGSSNSYSPVNNVHQSPASTPDVRRRIVEYVEQVDGSGEGSRPSSGQQSSGHSNNRYANGVSHDIGKIYREVRLICHSAQQQISESNISRKEKVIHIVHGADDQDNSGVTKQPSTNKPEQSLDPTNPTFLNSNTNQPQENKSQSDPSTTTEKPASPQKLFINRDNISPPPTPRVGAGEDGEGLSMDVFMKCVDWLDGVHKANEHRTLDVVTLPPIKWDE